MAGPVPAAGAAGTSRRGVRRERPPHLWDRSLMKLARFGPPGRERPALVDRDGRLRDLSGLTRDICGAMLGHDAIDLLRAIDPDTLPLVEGEPRIGPCVAGVGKFLCIGLNYSDHAAETGAVVPPEPVRSEERRVGKECSARGGITG